MSKSRDIATILGATETSNTSNAALITAAEAGGGGGGVTSYDSIGALPLSGNSAGDLAFVDSADRLYVNNGAGWYSISLINATPTFTSVTDSDGGTTPFTLSTDGSATVITATATDSDGLPLTYSYSVTSGSLTNGGGTTATVSQSDNVFTITPTTTEDYAGSFTLTFTASDGINTGTSANVFSLQFMIANSQYTTFLMKADASATDNQVDASSNSLTITENGNVTSTALTPYHPKGYSTYFDNSGDYLVTESTSNVAIGSGDFTCELWWYPTGTMGQFNKLITTGTSSNCFAIEAQSAGLTLSITDYSSTVFGTANTALNQNEWNHIAVVRSSGTMKMYLNGTEVLSFSNTTNFTGTYVQAGWSSGVQGNVRDVRLVVGTAVYTSAFSPPTEPLTAIANTKLLMCHLPYIADGSTNDLSITAYGDTKTVQFGPYDHGTYSKSPYGGSVYFDGSGDYLSTNDAAMTISGEFTIEGWFYTTDTGTQNIFHWAAAGIGEDNDLILNANGVIKCRIGTGGNTFTTSSSGLWSPNTWHHFAVVRNSSNNVDVYLDGNAIIDHGTRTTDLDNTLEIARNPYNGGVDYFTGYIADVRVVGSAVYTADFTPPTEPLTAISGTQLLTCTNKNQVWDDAGGNKITIVSDSQASTTQYKWSNSITFDGNNDYIYTSNIHDKISTGDFTAEAWVYLDEAIGSNRGIFGSGSSDGDDQFTLLLLSSGLLYFDYGGSQDYVQQSSATFTAQTWHHVAITRSGTSLNIWLDGTSVASATVSADIGGAANFAVGWARSIVWKGYIEDARLSIGLARYTSSFTPPSAAFDG